LSRLNRYEHDDAIRLKIRQYVDHYSFNAKRVVTGDCRLPIADFETHRA
jgi:hypothetical protein